MFAFVNRLDEKYNNFMDHNSSYVTMFTFAYVGLFTFTKDCLHSVSLFCWRLQLPFDLFKFESETCESNE